MLSVLVMVYNRDISTIYSTMFARLANNFNWVGKWRRCRFNHEKGWGEMYIRDKNGSLYYLKIIARIRWTVRQKQNDQPRKSASAASKNGPHNKINHVVMNVCRNIMFVKLTNNCKKVADWKGIPSRKRKRKAIGRHQIYDISGIKDVISAIKPLIVKMYWGEHRFIINILVAKKTHFTTWTNC